MRFLAALAVLFVCLAAEAKTLRWSSQGDYLTADPHGQNEGINNLINDEIFERLVVRGRKLELVPGLATKWEMVSPTRWRFTLRRGVTFHDGSPFTADDVVFSIERAQMPTSNFKVFAAPIGKARKVDDFTVEFETPAPTPVLVENVALVNMVSRAWCEKNGAQRPQDFKSGEETFSSRNANGTGPFMLVRREAEIATVLRKNPKWWGLAEGRFDGNVDEVVYRPIKSDATRMAALLSGELDMVLDPPLQDIPRLKTDPAIRVIEGPENRVIFLVMDQQRDELKYSSVKGKNPLKDLRVRQAFYLAIDVEAIRRQVMRGQALPTGAMIPAAHRTFPDLEPRLFAPDPQRAKKLLAQAGYPGGFEIGLLCPNNRYVNDERICTALAGMLAKVGVKVNLTALPRAQFFQKVDQWDVTMHLYGWGGATTDPGFTLTPVIHSHDGKGKGDFNSGRFIDPQLDEWIDAAAGEMDAARRTSLIHDAFRRVRDNVYTIPLHRQVIPWAVRKGVNVVHRADNVLESAWVRIE